MYCTALNLLIRHEVKDGRSISRVVQDTDQRLQEIFQAILGISSELRCLLAQLKH